MPQRSKITRLPVADRREVDAAVLRGEPYRDIEANLRGDGHDISRESVRRYGARLLERAERVRAAAEFAASFRAGLAEQGAATTDVAMEAFSALAMEALLALDVADLRSDPVKVAEALAKIKAVHVAERKVLATESIAEEQRRQREEQAAAKRKTGEIKDKPRSAADLEKTVREAYGLAAPKAEAEAE
jgi:hypothetical protein